MRDETRSKIGVICDTIRAGLGSDPSDRDLATAVNYWIFRNYMLDGPTTEDIDALIDANGSACGGRTILFSHLCDAFGVKSMIVGLHQFAGGSHSLASIEADDGNMMFDPLTGGYYTQDRQPDGIALSVEDVLATKGTVPMIVPFQDGSPCMHFAQGGAPDASTMPEIYSPNQGLYGPDIETLITGGMSADHLISNTAVLFYQAQLRDGEWRAVDWAPFSIDCADGSLVLARDGLLENSQPLPWFIQRIGEQMRYKNRVQIDVKIPGLYDFKMDYRPITSEPTKFTASLETQSGVQGVDLISDGTQVSACDIYIVEPSRFTVEYQGADHKTTPINWLSLNRQLTDA